MKYLPETYEPVRVKVWGEWACFSRPEMKVERVSYEVMTPSAARGILEAIFWKPQMQWEVRAIEMLRPVRFHGFVRNEVTKKANPATALSGPSFEQRGRPLGLQDEKVRTQRHTLALRDVAYIIVADVRVADGVAADPAKYRDQFRRRVERGECYIRPYLGCREFSAFFSAPDPNDHPFPVSANLGRMLFDLLYEPGESGRGMPLFFDADLEQGVIQIPPYLYERRHQHAAPKAQ